MAIHAGICERLAKHHRFTRSGLPDLIVWNPQTKVSSITPYGYGVSDIDDCMMKYIYTILF